MIARNFMMLCSIVALLAIAGGAAPAAVLDQHITGFEAGEGYTGVTADDKTTTGMITNHADWSGGAQAGITNDDYDWGTNADGSWGDEKIVNYESYTGDQCFRLDREYGSSGQGSLFGKTLTASMPTHGDTVRVSFAFKPVAGSPDDSFLSVQSGAASGTDKADHLVLLEYSSSDGFDHGLSVGNWDLDNNGDITYAATGLDPSLWHTCEAALTFGGGWTTGVPGSLVGPDILSISVDGGTAVSFPLDGTNMWRYSFSDAAWAYQSHDRAKFQCLNGYGTAGGIDTQTFDHSGFYIDDLSYQITPEPATLSLLALGGLALVRRRRK